MGYDWEDLGTWEDRMRKAVEGPIVLDIESVSIRPLSETSPWSTADGDLKRSIVAVLAAEPALSLSGLDGRQAGIGRCSEERHQDLRRAMLVPDSLAQFDRAARFLTIAIPHATRHARRNDTTYYWKHQAETWAGSYVSNGMFVAAALALGWRLLPVLGSPNPLINLGATARGIRSGSPMPHARKPRGIID